MSSWLRPMGSRRWAAEDKAADAAAGWKDRRRRTGNASSER